MTVDSMMIHGFGLWFRQIRPQSAINTRPLTVSDSAAKPDETGSHAAATSLLCLWTGPNGPADYLVHTR
jgi:hypothetical protein